MCRRYAFRSLGTAVKTRARKRHSDTVRGDNLINTLSFAVKSEKKNVRENARFSRCKKILFALVVFGQNEC